MEIKEMIRSCIRVQNGIGCGKKIEYRGKTGKSGSTGFFEVDTGIEHTYYRCDKLIEYNVTAKEKQEKEAREQTKLSDMGFMI